MAARAAGDRGCRRSYAVLPSRSAQAKEQLRSEPEITVRQTCAEMVRENLNVAQRRALLKLHGNQVPVAVEN